MDWDGQQDLGETGPVMLVAFDARESHWGTVRDGWSQMPCETKLRAATMVPLPSSGFFLNLVSTLTV